MLAEKKVALPPKPAPRFTTQDLLQKLADGVAGIVSSEDWRRHLEFQARFHRYSFGNQMLIAIQKPDATMVAGFHLWKKMNRNIKKGEKGIAILVPCFPRKDEIEKDPDKPVFFKTAYVFDVSQTDGAPLPETKVQRLRGEGEYASWMFERLADIAEEEGIRLDLDPSDLHGANGYYMPKKTLIAISPDLSPNHRVKTLVHELAHHFCHKQGIVDTYAHGEAEAEGTAFVVCSHFGLDTSDYTFGYVAHWNGEDAAKVIKSVGTTIQRVSEALIDRIDPPVLEADKEEEMAL